MGKGLKSLISHEELVEFATSERVVEAIKAYSRFAENNYLFTISKELNNHLKQIEQWKSYLSQDYLSGTSDKCSK